MKNNLHRRFLETTIREALSDTPVVLIHGSRQCGKTTLARHIGDADGYEYITLDDQNQLVAAQTDPIGFINNLNERTILDEIQRVPKLFTAIKASVDQNRKPGRFILTGSSNILLVPNLADSLAGRMEVVHLRPLAQLEIAGHTPALLDNLFTGQINEKTQTREYPSLRETLADLIVSGGYPAALARKTQNRRSMWYKEYINTIVQRDIQDIAHIRNAHIIPKLLALAASQTARLFNSTNLAAPFAVSRPTIQEYLNILEQLFLLDNLQPWFSNRLSRLIKTPKMHICDTGIACALLGVDSQQLWQDRPLFGQLLETFIYQELRKMGSWSEKPLNFYHFRNKDKVEVDIIIEQGRKTLGIEIKASATIEAKDFKGLHRLKEGIANDFFTGVVFYDGTKILSFGDKLFAIPISILTGV